MVDLAWDANTTDPQLAGYDVYRGVAPGSHPNKLNGSVLTEPLFTDTTVGNDITYYYVVTSVDLWGNSSVDSTEVGATPMALTLPVAAFSGAPTSGNAPLPVSFSDQSTGSPTTWSWDFGDGNSSTAQNPTHTYDTPGAYSVVLSVTNPQGSDSLTLSNYITVNTGGFTGQGFTLSKNADFSTDDRVFTQSETLYMLVWSDNVDFNNIKKAEFELKDPNRQKVRQNLINNFNYSFTASFVLADLPSNHTSWEWKGKAEDQNRNKYQPRTNITINPAATPPVADFTGTPTSGSTPLVVSFTDQSTGSPASWLWNFGDGNTSTAQSPSHTYSAVESYDVTLTATNAEGSDTLGRTDYITVTMPSPPVAAFSGAPTSGNAPLPVSFTDQSTGSPTTWSWDFGDGNASTAQNPTHTYGTPGTYSVVLTATNPQGSDSLTLSNYITINTGGFTGQGFILSKNADFSTDDRIFSRTDTLYMLMWSDVVDFNNMKKAEFELKDTNRQKVRQNLINNFNNSFTTTFVLANLPSNLTSWEWKGKLEDQTKKKYQPKTNIAVN